MNFKHEYNDLGAAEKFAIKVEISTCYFLLFAKTFLIDAFLLEKNGLWNVHFELKYY